MRRSLAAELASVCLVLVFSAAGLFAATIGTVVPVVGQLSDLAYDDQRDLVYLANFAQSRVEIYSVGGRLIVSSISTNPQPVALAMSPDRQTLWVACQQNSTLVSINLSSNSVSGEYPLQSRPEAIAVGYDGQVLVYGQAGLLRYDPVNKQLTQLQISPPPVPPAALAASAVSPLPQGFRAGLMASGDGKIIIGLGATAAALNSAMRLFVYDVASGSVLRSRNVSGLSSVLSVAPDGSRFMAGPFLFATNSLTILGHAGYIPATNLLLTGGSVFSPDGSAVFASFSTQTPINSLNPNQPAWGSAAASALGGRFATGSPTLGVLQVLRASSLTPQLGLRLPENITAKIIRSADGQNLFALSASGLLVIPVGQLDRQPILDVETTNVVLSADICNRSVVTAQVQVRNAGAGRLTFSGLSSAGASAPLVITQSSAAAPSTLRITFDGRRANASALGTGQYAVYLTSPEAVNIEPVVLVNLNFRDVNQQGAIIPINGLGTDLLLDEPRQRLYIANFMRDQVEVYSLPDRRFLPPIPVGSQPFSMALANASTLVVANSGAERISVVDLDAMQEVDQVNMGPIPLNATALVPRSIAASSNAVMFSTMTMAPPGQAPGAGSLWQLSMAERQAFPRLNLGANTTNTLNGRNLVVAPANGSAIVVADAGGSVRLYDPQSDSFPIIRSGALTGYRGTAAAAADGSFYVIDNQVFNTVLTVQGSLAPAGGNAAAAAAFGVAAAGSSVVRVQAADQQVTVQRIQQFNLPALAARNEYPLPEAAMDITPSALPSGSNLPITGGGGTPTPTPGRGGTPVPPTPVPPGRGGVTPIPVPAAGGGSAANAAMPRVWPSPFVSRLFGAQGQTQLVRTGLVVDSQNNAYMLTVSGLSVIPLSQSSARAPSFSPNSVVNGASFKGPVSPGSIISLFGTDLGTAATAGQVPLPTNLGGVCVTANQSTMPLFYTSPTQINAQLPAELAPGRVTLNVRSQDTGKVSAGIPITVSAAAPGVFTMDVGGRTQAALFHVNDFTPVTPNHPGKRDTDLILFATGLGRVTPAVSSGAAASANPLSKTAQNVSVTIGGHPMIVTFAGLAPGFVGLYQINIRVPGDRVQGDNLPVVVSVGSTPSPASGAPLAAIH